MSRLTEANELMNAGVNNRSTATSFVPLLLEEILEIKGLSAAKDALEYVLPEEAYNKPHHRLDRVIENFRFKLVRYHENTKVNKKV